MSAAAETHELLTIGAVCDRLKPEFPDISISKIRYLEGEGLLNPKRTRGGYRLFSEDDLERLETILRLQRDQFLPLRVIREELASPRSRARRQKPSGALGQGDAELDLTELCGRAGIDAELARELEDYGLLTPRVESGERMYTEMDAEIAEIGGRLFRYGIAPRHLRTFRTSAGREADLMHALVAPSLRARNPERREQGVVELQQLAELGQELWQRLFWRDVRRMVS
jgi:DNA-binding transcriptional MerR regulator